MDRLLGRLFILVVLQHDVLHSSASASIQQATNSGAPTHLSSNPELSSLAQRNVLAILVDQSGLHGREELAAGTGDSVVDIGKEGDAPVDRGVRG